MDRFSQMQVFQAVTEEEGFAAAARRLKMSPPAVTRTVAALEQRLGVRLLNRTTRYVRPTETGLRYLEDTRKILEEVEAADDAAAGINAEPRGHLRITAPILFGKLYVLPSVTNYLNKYPEMKIEALFLDRVVNLIEESIDVGVRIGELPDSSYRALKVGSVRQVLVAAPSYLKKSGLPRSLEELQQHSIIASSAGSFTEGWRFHSEQGDMTVRIKPRLRVTTNDAAIDAAVSGFGITRIISYQVAEYLQNGQLKIVLANFEKLPLPVHIIHREGRGGAIRTRSFIDALAEDLRANKYLN